MRLRTATLRRLADEHGGEVYGDAQAEVGRFVPIQRASRGDVAPLLGPRWVREAVSAKERGACLLIDASLRHHPIAARLEGWVHPFASWAMAGVLETRALVPEAPARMGRDAWRAESAWLGPRVVAGERVRIGAGSVIGSPGFGWAVGPDGAVRAVPQLGGVVIEDDVSIGPLCTIDAGTLSPTVVRRGTKIDAHVHVAHNCDIGEGCMIAAQSGFAGSVKLGRGVLVGGQVGIADHVSVGDGARIAAKSGVIGDVPAGAVVAGYPAVPRGRWLRALARLYRALGSPPS